MNKRLIVATVATGALGIGAVAAAVPALAGPAGRPDEGRTAVATGDGNGGYGWHGDGRAGAGMPGGRHGAGQGDGTCLGLADAPAGSLTADQKHVLAAMAEEEKLAGDLYRAFADTYDAVIFSRIAASEDQHLASVRGLLDRYGVADPTKELPAGQFATPATQKLYDDLLAKGMTDQRSALEVGRQVEKTDIADLTEAAKGVTAGDVTQVYQHLLRASQQHLDAFESRLTQ